jgi:hypothetical protein
MRTAPSCKTLWESSASSISRHCRGSKLELLGVPSKGMQEWGPEGRKRGAFYRYISLTIRVSERQRDRATA